MASEITTLCADQEIGARVFVQVAQFLNLIQVSPYTDETFKNAVFKTAGDLMNKMSSVRFHRQRFCEHYEQRLTHHCKRDPTEGGRAFHIEEERQLVGDFESFLAQSKSTLDIATKILIPCAGFGPKNAETFKDSGDGVIKLLSRDSVRKLCPEDRIEPLIQLIQWNQDLWLRDLVGKRTDSTHRQPIQGLKFRFQATDGEKIGLVEPSVGVRGQKVRYPDFTHQIERLLFDFCRDFIAFSIFLRAPAGLVLIELNEAQSVQRWGFPEARYVRWGAGIPASQ